jgi:tellurite resistance protein TehA-like permease
VSLNVSQARWGGQDFTIAAYVIWWIGAAWIFGTLFFVFFVLISRHSISDCELTPLIFVPAVSVAMLSSTGGLVSSYSTNISPGLAVPVIIMYFCSVGVGLIMAMFLYTYLLHRLLAKGRPHAEQVATMFMFVGPLGQCDAALQLLSSVASTYSKFAGYNQGTFLARMAAMPLDVACALLALLITGMATVWLVFAFFVMFFQLFRRELRWNPMWNPTIFPTGTLATSTLQLGAELDSAFFKVVTGILIVFLVIVFFGNLGATVWQVAKRELLVVKEDPRVKAQMGEVQKER